MAGAARIGALHVMLGLDSAEFSTGLAKANSGLSKFSKAAKVGFAVVAAAATAAGAALSVAVKGAIDRADDLSKTAQRIGTTTEALSRLEWAAKLSDVSLSQLSTGLQRLSRNMLDVSNGVGAQAKTAFDALGIAVVDTEGKLRSSDEVFAEIADRFSRMPDSAEKTALAMQLLGRAGAEMIPLLNSGKQGLADMAAESDRLGNTISTNTGRAAEQFNDSLTRVQTVMGGVVNKIMEAVLPSLNRLGDLLASPEFAANAQQISTAIVDGMALAVEAVNAVVGAFNSLREAMAWASTHDMFGNKMEPSQWDTMKGTIDARKRLTEQLNAGNTGVDVGSLYRGIFASPAASSTTSEPFGTGTEEVFETIRSGASGAKAGVDALKQAMTEGQAVFTATRTPAEAYKIELERLNDLLQEGAIDQDTYNRAVRQAQDAFQQAEASGKQWVTSLADSLSGLFGSILDGSKTAMEAVNDLIKSFAQMALQAGFKMLLGGLFGGGSGGGFLGIPGFANGTNYAPGGLAMVGERGPELVNLPRGSQVTPNSELMAGGATRVLVELGPDLEGRILTQSAGQSVQIVAASQPDTVQKSTAAAGKALAGGDYRRGMASYGLQQQAKRR
jgi:hypothetical protein